MATATSALLSFFLRDPHGLSLLAGPPFDGEPACKLSRIPCIAAVFSNDGCMLAVTTENSVDIYDTQNAALIRSIKVSRVKAVAFSPKGTFLQTFEPPDQSQKNVTLWNLKTGESAFQQFQKTFSKSTWPAIQFSDDETVSCRMVTNEVHFFYPQDFTKGIVDKLRLAGIQIAQLGTSPPSHIAAYVPEAKGQPAAVRIFELEKVSQGDSIARRSFYKSSSARLLWNRGSTALLVLAQSDVDKTNQSYYGEARLHFLRSNGSHEGSVPLSKEGPVHDVQWSPTGKEFLVVYGFMPACATLFDDRCRVLHNFKSGPYNTVRWNPHGRFLCLAGFGNLPGDMVFWERTELSCLGSTRAECSVSCEWSPNGRYLLTATTAPRLQVDNGIKIFRYDGSLHFEKKYDKLFQVEWKPSAFGVYEDRPVSPKFRETRKAEKGNMAESGALKSTVAASKPAAYQSPHAKAAAAVRAQLLGEENTSASKNKKSRDKQKKKKQVAESDTVEVTDVGKHVENLSLAQNGDGDAIVQADDKGKKLRSLHKKLRQIEEIKQKIANGHSLDPAQQEKLLQEAVIREEIRTLEA